MSVAFLSGRQTWNRGSSTLDWRHLILRCQVPDMDRSTEYGRPGWRARVGL